MRLKIDPNAVFGDLVVWNWFLELELVLIMHYDS